MLLLASMETTPGGRRLDGVLAEAEATKRVVKSKCQAMYCHQADADADAVLLLMSSYDMFHFAGHGISDPVDPAQSCVIFEKYEWPSTSPVQGRLRVDRLFEVNF